MPSGWEADMPVIGQKLDWLGVNYYTRHLHAHAPGTPWPSLRDVPGDRPKTQMGWEIYPEGLHHFLTRMARDYVGQTPIYVTENGMANADVLEDGAITDRFVKILPLRPPRRDKTGHCRRGQCEGLLLLVASGQLRMGRGLRKALRPCPCRLRHSGAGPEILLSRPSPRLGAKRLSFRALARND
jgi:hypothetical protein